MNKIEQVRKVLENHLSVTQEWGCKGADIQDALAALPGLEADATLGASVRGMGKDWQLRCWPLGSWDVSKMNDRKKETPMYHTAQEALNAAERGEWV